jgi:hypothetical protein
MTNKLAPLRAITVCVDYLDYLSITLPINREHFSEYWVVTSPQDEGQVSVLAGEHGCRVVVTDLFWRGGARFNKWAALEHGLDVMGRHGWLTILDADIVYPRGGNSVGHFRSNLRVGCLYSPLRRMCPFQAGDTVPEENTWQTYPLHGNTREWAGYSQTFHTSDPVLPQPPWHQTNWRHAGGADSFFQGLWAPTRKIRPPWECLHLGPAHVNWCGRVSPSVSPNGDSGQGDSQSEERKRLAAERTAELQRFMKQRWYTRGYDHEKLK